MHIEFLLEEPSAEVFLQGFVGKLLPPGSTWRFIVFQGKKDLLFNLPSRLKAYSQWMPPDYRLVVLVDDDREDCAALKRQLETAALLADLPTKSKPKDGKFVVLNRIAVEELEAWIFGDPEALCAAFPRVPKTIGRKAPYRNPDAISGGTWESLERVLKSTSYFNGGLPKIQVAREVAKHLDPRRNASMSFRQFVQGLEAL
jgi:hypothetical protein